MPRQDLGCNAQADPRTGILRAEEGLKDPLGHFLGNPGSPVAHADDGVTRAVFLLNRGRNGNGQHRWAGIDI